LVPGVNVGKGWAKALAQVAAWSTVAAMITSCSADIKLRSANHARRPDHADAEDLSAVRGARTCTLAVPVIVGMVFPLRQWRGRGIIGAGYAL